MQNNRYNKFCGHQCSSVDQINLEGISSLQLQSLLKNNHKRILLIDVRGAEEARICHIPGSILIPLPELISDKYLRQLRNTHKDKIIIVYCKTGIRSLKAINALQNEHIHAKHLQGGITAWNVASISNQN